MADEVSTAAPVFLGNIGDDAIYRVDLASSGLGTIQSIIIHDDNLASASSATGATSGFDLDFVKLANTSTNSATEAAALTGLSVFNFTSGVTFHAGTMLPLRFGDPASWDRSYLFGTSASGSYLPSVATLGTRDGANGIEQGAISLGENGSIVFTFSQPISTAGLYLYFGDVGNANDGSYVLVSGELPNTPLSAVDDAKTTSEDASVVVSVLANDSDGGGGALTVTGTSAPANGAAVVNGNGTITYTPKANFNGEDSFTYTVSDGKGGTDTATVTIDVAAVNDAPTAPSANSVTTKQNTASSLVTIGASDVDGDALTYSVKSGAGPAKGSVSFAGGKFIYTPTADATGSDSFTIRIDDGHGGIKDQAVAVTITPVDDSSVAVDDSKTTSEDAPVIVAVLANDGKGGVLTVTGASSPANGTAAVNGDGTITYTPKANFSGKDSFTYTVSDGKGGTDTATVTIDVAAVNDAPTAPSTSSVTTKEDTASSAVAIGASDVDGDTLTYSVKSGASPAKGSVSFSGGKFTYTPSANATGSDSFTIRIDDGYGGVKEQAVAVTITAVNDAPVAGDDSKSTSEDASVIVSVLANDSDGEGEALTVTGTSAPANGTAVVNENGTITYTPKANFSGKDSFTYTVSDGKGGTDSATVTIDVAPANDVPTAPSTNSVTTKEDTASSLIAIGASDADGDALTYSVKSGAGPAKGSVTFAGNKFIYTPTANAAGSDSFTIRIDDGHGGVKEQAVAVTITPMNDAPVAGDDRLTASDAATVTYQASALLANDKDVDGGTLSIIGVTTVNGAVSLSGSTIQFTPNAGFAGGAGFDYTVSDGQGGTDTAHVTVTPATRNEDPQLDPTQALATLQDMPVALEVVASDPNGDPLAYSAGAATHGTVTGGAEGRFTYTPDDGFTGTDSFAVTVADGEGGTAVQAIEVSIAPRPPADDWSLVASDGFTGEVARMGMVLGTAGHQSIAVLDMPGAISFDPSFNRGGDVIRLEGDAAAWCVARSGSSAVFCHDDTTITVPVGIEGMEIVFDNAVCTLRLDTAAGTIMIGDQTVAGALAPITATGSGMPPADGGDAEALGRLFVAEEASVVVGGTLDIFGTNGSGEISLTYGNVRLDPSFNRGNHRLTLDAAAEDFIATRAGSSALLESADLEVLIPVGTAGMTINFTDGARIIRYDPALDAMLIGEQPISLTPTHLTDFA